MADRLNQSQQDAVEHDTGPLLVLAGAGSGKTRVVTQRIARLLERGVHARSILAMTFTNKAAGEMVERVAKLVGHRTTKDLTIGTFHHFGLSVLRAHARALSFTSSKFVIFDQGDTSGVVRETLRALKNDKGFDIGGILGRISHLKNEFVDPADPAEIAKSLKGGSTYDETTALVYPLYVNAMRGFQALDFDDLVCEVVRLWRRRPEILEKYQQRFRYVIVDEYQDTNRAQLELVRLLGSAHKNVCVVGDDDQSIYAWRGADVRNILDFEHHFTGAKVVKLEENYRSSEAILEVASVVLQKSSAKRHDKRILPVRARGERVKAVVTSDAEAEATFIGDIIGDMVTRGEARPRDFAVLYRSNQQSADLEAALKERQVAYTVYGGTQFFERKEVKDLLAYLRVVLTPKDELAVRRIINYPARGIGDVALERLGLYSVEKDITLFDAIHRADDIYDLSAQAREGCRAFGAIVDRASKMFDRGDLSMPVARALAEDIGLKTDIYAAAASNAAAARRWGNVESILNVFNRRDEKGFGHKKPFSEFLRLIALRDSDDDARPGDAVVLTTMHGAKGLEFPHVFIAGLEEGLLPHLRSQTERVTDLPMADGAVSLEEERRLFYVAVTRARDTLHLCRAERRVMRGKTMARVASRFLLEIPEDMLDLVDRRGDRKPEADRTAVGSANLLAALSMPSEPAWRR